MGMYNEEPTLRVCAVCRQYIRSGRELRETPAYDTEFYDEHEWHSDFGVDIPDLGLGIDYPW